MHRPSSRPKVAVDVIEEEKENLVPLQGGRPVSKLATTLANSRNYSLDGLKAKLQQERDQFELQLRNLDDLDDPLQVYLSYIDWTHRNYPQGANTFSDLFGLLERCASKFRDISLYKNDSRYLKVWLEYIDYHDTPRDAYIYLATKKIGIELALFYEEFARHLELKDRFADAHGVYEIGIQHKAFPIGRLERSFERFKARTAAKNISASPPSEDIRNALSLKQGRRIEHESEPESEEKPSKRSKIDVYQDNADENLNSIRSAFEKDAHQDVPLEAKRSRIKENTLAPTRWSGQILRQKHTGPSTATEKLQVFCDNPPNSATSRGDTPEIHRSIHPCKDALNVYTLVEVPGKRAEKLMLNMDLLYPELDSEFSPTELLAMQRRVETKTTATKPENSAMLNQDHDTETKTFTIPSIDDTLTSKLATKDPTITMYSKMAKNEVFGIFNQASQTYEQPDFSDTRIEEPTVTNLDSFVTETLHAQKMIPKEYQEPLVATQVDEPVANAQSVNYTSSPFLLHPPLQQQAKRPPELNTTDPLDPQIKTGILQNLVIPLTTYPGYFDKSNKIANQFFRITDANSQNTAHPTILDCLGDEMYSLISCFKKQECSLVYLAESDSGSLKVLKVSRPATSWEFFILRRVRRRLLNDLSHEKKFAKAESLFSFGDESFLVLEYYPQGNLMEVIKLFKAKGKPIDECLAVFFSIRLLEAIETLHGMDIIHGCVNTENCMINFAREDRSFSQIYDRSGKYGWDKKRLTLIDFGASIDLTEFQKGTKFLSSSPYLGNNFLAWMDGEPWTFEIDYFGLANTIHALLFDESLQFVSADERVQIRRSLSEFWQPQLWQELFEVLLNPNSKIGHQANALYLKRIRRKLEEWLENYSEAGNLKGSIVSLEEELGSTM
ncbi:BUB1 [Candida margitis]|uniref:BUB1 n=1 Tax=Candida margitis TaxID=1775924 RepID=UPI00222659AF|nr:BUB1 [Candida margitis]KAI5970253.1 BUB1 [Candida margitis]